MRNLISSIVVLFIIAGFLSCAKKPVVEADRPPIEGIWSIKRDSTTTGTGSTATGVNYVGKSSDYFDFRSNNKLYIKEGDKLDTLAYQLKSDTLVYLGAVGSELYGTYSYNAHLRGYNSTDVTIFVTPITFNPTGYTSKIIVLQR